MSENLRICIFSICGTTFLCVFLKSGRLRGGAPTVSLWEKWKGGHLSIVFLLSGTVGRCSSCLSLRELERGAPLYCIPALWHGWAVLQLTLWENCENLKGGHLSVVFLLSGTVGRCSSCLSLREVTMLRNQRAMTKDLNRRRKGSVWPLQTCKIPYQKETYQVFTFSVDNSCHSKRMFRKNYPSFCDFSLKLRCVTSHWLTQRVA